MRSQSDYIVFADESGDHSLTMVNPDYPVFVLSLCIFRKQDYIETVCPLIQRFKLRWWPHDAMVLHGAQIRRQRWPFIFLNIAEKREQFMVDLTETLASCPFTLISGVIRKLSLRERYVQPENPYSLALKYCLERTYEFLRGFGQHELETPFLFECRGKREDAELELVLRRLCGGESCWGKMPGFSVEFFDKKANLPGLQIADLVSLPIGQHVVRPERKNRAFEMIRQKFCRSPDDDASTWGVKVFP
jgi:uncharacterized protein DUF3800